MILTWEKKVAKNPIHEMEGERARDRRRRKNSITACAAHFDDLIKAYPKGVPLAKDRKVRFVPACAAHFDDLIKAYPKGVPLAKDRKVRFVPRHDRKWNSSQKRWLQVK